MDKWAKPSNCLSRDEYLEVRTRQAVNALLAKRRKDGENVALLSVKLSAFLQGMFAVVYNDAIERESVCSTVFEEHSAE